MTSVNKVILVGRVGKDPEVRYTAQGDPVANLSLATSYRTKSGEEQTEWHNIVAYNTTADIVSRFVRKGALAYFEGRLRTRKWEDKSGNTRYTTEVLADRVIVFSPKASSERVDVGDAKASDTASGLDGMNEDIPF